jgi:hypothetical protein
MDCIVREAIEIELHPNNITVRLFFVSAGHGSLSSAPSRNLLNMTPIYKTTQVYASLTALAYGYRVNDRLIALYFPHPR